MIKELVIGLLMVAGMIAIIWCAKKDYFNTEYDERQIASRGKAYQISFLTTLLFVFLSGIAYLTLDYMHDYAAFMLFASEYLGVVVFAGTAIWNDAFYSTVKNRNGYIVITVAAIVSNAASFFMNDDMSFTEKLLSVKGLNLLGMIAFTIIMIVFVVKKFADQKEED